VEVICFSGRHHAIDLLFFEIIGDVLHLSQSYKTLLLYDNGYDFEEICPPQHVYGEGLKIGTMRIKFYDFNSSISTRTVIVVPDRGANYKRRYTSFLLKFGSKL